VFTDRAVEYRTQNNVRHADALCAVVVQRMVRSVVAGTVFSVEIGTGYAGIHIAASLGLGEAVVSGDVTSDEWLLHAARLEVVKQTRGSKRFQYVSQRDGERVTSGVERVAVSAEQVCLLCC
jgi:pyruvate,water dikinase